MLNGVLRVCVLLLVGVLTTLPALAQSKRALIIGNAAYAALPKLANPANDAKLIADNLTQVGFTVTAVTDQSQAQMKAAIALFSEEVSKAGEDTIALFYYAGHGVQIDGVNYLIPVDANVNTAGDVVLGAVSASDLLKTIELARAKVNVLVLDACRDNPFKGSTRGFTRGLARVEAPAGSIVAYATAPGQVAQDGDTANSPYAEALSKHIATPGLSLEDVFRKVRIDVSAKTNNAQVPWEETSLREEVVLAGIAAVTDPDVPKPDDTPAKNTSLDATRAYVVAVADNSIKAYADFLKQHPDAKEAPQAMRNMEMLNDEANWRKAAEQNTRGSYRIYLNLHPEGAYLAEAKAKLAALDSSATPPPPPPPPKPLMIEADGFDVFGTDLEALRDVTFTDCSAICAANSSCAAVSYRSDLKRCYVKSAVSLLVQNAKSAISVKPDVQANLRASNFQIVPQADYPGFDIGDVKLESTQDCLQACESRSDCQAFAYVTRNKTCWLKSGYGEAVAAPPVVSGIRTK
jgi:Caspase domain/PAN domain